MAKDMMKTTSFTMACAAGALIVLSSAGSAVAHDPGYVIQEFPPFEGDVLSHALAVNAAGHVVGFSEDASGLRTPFFWDGNTQIALEMPGTVVSATATGLNNADKIVGYAEYVDGVTRAVMWQGGSFVGIAEYPQLGASGAFGVGPTGLVVGGGFVNPLSEEQALTWTGVVPAMIGEIGVESAALAINDNDQIVGWMRPGGGDLRAFLYDGDEMTDLGVLPDGVASVATSINDDGEVAGYCEVQGEESGTFAFKWDGIEMTNLGTLGSDTSQAFGMNLADYVVGSSILIGTGDLNAVLWRPDRQINLNSLLLPGSGWDYLAEGTGINNQGQIVGWGYIDGSVSGFMLEPVLGLADPVPGIAGEINTFDAAGADPGSVVYFVYGFDWGTTPIPFCPGMNLNIDKPKILGSQTADEIGHAILNLMVPQAAKNIPVIFQAIEPSTCEVSFPTSWTFF